MTEPGIIVTNCHVVQGAQQVIIEGAQIKKRLSRVVFIDPKYDLAFLEGPKDIELPEVSLALPQTISQGQAVVAIGHPFGLKYTATQGIISNAHLIMNDISYIQHDAALNPGNSGGPLVDQEGRILGVNTFIIRDGQNIGFSLPVSYLAESIDEFFKMGSVNCARCISCANLVSEKTVDNHYCPYCGTKIALPASAEEYIPTGVSKTIETLIQQTGHEVALSRKGPLSWEIRHGSAKIEIAYHEKTGLILADAYLCQLPKENIKPIYEFLLQQNYALEHLMLSVHEQDIILSLLIFDRHLNPDTGIQMLRNLFEKADHFDNILVESYGAIWKVDV